MHIHGVVMKKAILLTGRETEVLERLGRRLRRARLRRDLSQADMAERIGVTRKTYAALETGTETVNIGALIKTLSVLGYEDRFADLLASDPLGEDLEDVHGRQRASALARG
jgi:transcriptional regulator with XRE-family HTH domain